MKSRNIAAGGPPLLEEADLALGLRPLTARSVLVSMLLGTHPPRLPVRVLVAAADLFGISPGATRTALSRMVAADEVGSDDGWYELRGELVDRQQRQDEARTAHRRDWDGTWRTLLAPAEGRSAPERTATRAALATARYAQLRDGVWARPDNLAEDVVVGRLVAQGWTAARLRFDHEPAADELWPLDDWCRRAAGLGDAIGRLTPALERGDEDVLARGFVVAAAILRLFRADPLLPDDLLPEGWPGAALRADYDRFDEAYRRLLQEFFRSR